ncbi:MAG: ATP-binding protein, partial [Ghiorsea sp.]|nr:ATP-binding protein [Ghiorsea sp.]
RQIIENLQDIYYEIDLHGQIIMVSPSIRLLGYTVDDMKNKNMQEFFVDNDQLNVLLLTLQDSDNSQIHNLHIRVRHHDGRIHWLSMNAQYRYNKQQKPISIEGTLRDFTQVKEQQVKMQQADKNELLGLMAGSIAHNFNNILTSILGHASIARMAHEDNPKLVKHMDAIENSSIKAAEICTQMLAYTGQGNYSIQALQISQSLEKIQAMIRASIPGNITLNYALEADLPCIRADKSQIQQLAIDLILNAAESYEQEIGAVNISTGSQALKTQDLKQCFEHEQAIQGDYVYLRIQDTSCGIPQAMQQKIFEPFVTTKFMGRGLGLSAVRGIVRSHHGAIALESEEGKGTTFTVFFPIDNKT